MSNCGCDNPSSGEDDYLMVKANKSLANSCGDPSAAVTPVSACLIQEPTFDTIESGFVLPNEGSNIDINVCNVGAYTIGQYLEFVNYGAVLSVVSISEVNRTLTIKNSCTNGEVIDENPDAGLAIPRGSSFIVVGSPPCGEGAGASAILSALATVEEVCVPAMIEGSATARFQLVGRIEGDTGNLNQGKCLKRIPGVYFEPLSITDTGLTIDGTTDVQNDQLFNFDFAGIHRSTGKLRAFPSPALATGTIVQSAYIYTFSKTGTKPVGPVYQESFFNPFHLFEEKNTATNHATYTALASGGEVDKDFSVGISAINSVLKSDIDHYFLELAITVGMSANSGSGRRYLEVLLNDINVGYIAGGANGVAELNTFRGTVRVLKTDTDFNFKLKATGGGISYYYKVVGLSVKV